VTFVHYPHGFFFDVGIS